MQETGQAARARWRKQLIKPPLRCPFSLALAPLEIGRCPFPAALCPPSLPLTSLPLLPLLVPCRLPSAARPISCRLVSSRVMPSCVLCLVSSLFPLFSAANVR